MKICKLSILMILMLLPFFSFNQESKSISNKKIINEYLCSGSISIDMPIANNVKDVNGKNFDEKSLLKFRHLDISELRPAKGENVKFSEGDWKLLKADDEGAINIKTTTKKGDYQIQYLVSYIEASRWVEAKLSIESSDMLEVYLNGKSLGGIYSIDDEKGSFSKDLKFEKQNYTLVLKVLSKVEKTKKVKILASITPNESFVKDDLKIWTKPEYYMDIAHVLEGPRVNSVTISADGNYFLANYSEVTPPDGEKNKWIGIYEVQTKKVVRTIRNHKFSNIQWLPYGHKFSYVSEKILWISDAASGEIKSLTQNFDANNYQWSLSGKFVIYSVSESAPKKNELAQKYENMEDRWPWWRYRSFLYKLDVKTGVKQRLTFGNLSTNLHDISPNGNHIIYSESVIDNLERPFSKQYLYQLNLENLQLDTLWTKRFGGTVQYSPDGKKLLVKGGPAMFGDIGTNLNTQKIPNDYDDQAYIYSIKDKSVETITYDFDPKIVNAFWVNDASIYFKAEDKTYKNLYRYDIASTDFEKIETDLDMLSNINFSKKSSFAVFVANGLNSWGRAYSLDLKTAKTELLVDPEKDFFKDVKFGENEDWVYTKDDGTALDGFIYYPPNFDSAKKYPVIVYYYGGTSPISRNFRGRYPKELYTAHGYVVYVVNPSGATGYGQEFSAAHVNNWGITVADEIIDATKYFVSKHNFVNKDKVGCMGASYGGFMTMLLMTKTDIFATGISHAGISSISSYWGEGYWGYFYNSTAAADNYPWNNKKLYVDQSALFNADKQQNSLLLLHGGSDTNVPVGESIQLFTALRLLGKSVEFVEIPGENHWIVNYKKRIAWQKTIAAWFDKELKGEPQWWNDLYPDSNLK